MRSNQEELGSLSTDRRLVGRTAIVTGSSSGIGEAIARVLAASGAEVVVSGRDASRTRAVAESIVTRGDRAHAVATLGGHVDVMVNNAGIYPRFVDVAGSG